MSDFEETHKDHKRFYYPNSSLFSPNEGTTKNYCLDAFISKDLINDVEPLHIVGDGPRWTWCWATLRPIPQVQVLRSPGKLQYIDNYEQSKLRS